MKAGVSDTVDYLRSPRAIRDRAEALYALGLGGELAFHIDERRLPEVVLRVLSVTRRTYPDPRKIPYHGRLRHFGAGSVDRMTPFEAKIAALPADERLAARFELVITSVLLDAGAGGRWQFREPGGGTYARSEGLAVASYRLFTSGALSSDPRGAPHRADAEGLSGFDRRALEDAFQVSPENPLVGVEGRVALLRNLGRVVASRPEYFGTNAPRLGALGPYLRRAAVNGRLPARIVLATLLDAFGAIWPGREILSGENLGDVWKHPQVGYVPFHKLSQWLTYSLCEPLESEGVQVTDVSELTGLAEYRNGGLFLDAGVLVPANDALLGDVHDVSSTVVVEWRALTIALLDRTARGVRERLGFGEEELPLAKILEGGTWRAGREIAAEKRPDGGPPLRVKSDGTVF